MQKYFKIERIIIIILLIIVFIEGWFLYKEESTIISEEPVNEVFEPKENVIKDDNVKDQTSIYVDVKGAVEKPGVYETTDETIIDNVIKQAGGFKTNAYTNNINLSRRVTNEMVIYVYTKYEYSNINKKHEEKCTIVNEYDISDCQDKGISIIEKPNNMSTSDNENITTDSTQTKDNASLNAKININTALKEELMKLPGIGESKALSIIQYREENGLFPTIEDITKVSGIGPAMYDKIKDFITV